MTRAPGLAAIADILQVRRELAQLLLELRMIADVSAVNWDAGAPSTDDDIGGRRPPGAAELRFDKKGRVLAHGPKCKCEACESEWPGRHTADSLLQRMAQAEHFRTPLRRLMALRAIRDDAAAAVEFWHVGAALPPGVEPERDTLEWKRMIARSGESAEVLAKRHSISERTVKRYRKELRDTLRDDESSDVTPILKM